MLWGVFLKEAKIDLLRKLPREGKQQSGLREEPQGRTSELQKVDSTVSDRRKRKRRRKRGKSGGEVGKRRKGRGEESITGNWDVEVKVKLGEG